MEKLNLPDLGEAEALSFLFYQVPQVLVDDEMFSGLDGWAIILYSLMLNRAALSVKNSENFKDENGRLYIIFTVDEIMKRCRCGKNVAVKLTKQLEDIGLIEKKLQGLGKPALIYVKNFAYYNHNRENDNREKKLSTAKKSQRFKKQTSEVYKINPRGLKNKPLDVYKINRSHINQKNHIDYSNINPIDSAYPVDNSNKSTFDDIRLADNADVPPTGTSYNHNLNINNLISKHPDKKETLEEIGNLISEIFNGREQMFRIGRQNIEKYKIRSALNKIDNRHVEFVINSLKKDKKEIKSYRNYLLTALYNSSKQVFVDIDAVKNIVRKNINLDGLLNHYKNQRKDIEEIYGIIIETLVTQKKSFRIARGELPSELVKQSFADISEEHIHYVMESLRKNTSEVKSAKAFLQTCLWNSTKTINNHLSLDVRRFLYEHLGITEII